MGDLTVLTFGGKDTKYANSSLDSWLLFVNKRRCLESTALPRSKLFSLSRGVPSLLAASGEISAPWYPEIASRRIRNRIAHVTESLRALDFEDLGAQELCGSRIFMTHLGRNHWLTMAAE